MIHTACHAVRAAVYIRNTDTLISTYFAFLDSVLIYLGNLFNSKRIYYLNFGC